MRTLDIQTEPTEYQAPTITNVFLSIMKEANIPIPVCITTFLVLPAFVPVISK